jgi:hypothetical protein
LRRLALDLIGLPPTAEEVETFLADPSEERYQQTIDRLLADPRHGERWARHWMDIWRYSDWWGLGEQMRNSHPLVWHWRDWIVESLNRDLPYDEMLRQMLAADELYPNDLAKLRATGFLVRNYFLFNRNQWMDETVEHVGKGFLGLTMNCSKCHDHKYDPISQEEYYRMRAFFEPYHVRVDMVPGEMDLNRDGIPRAFDGAPQTPTYVFIRGDEGKPDKSKAMTPGVPEILALEPLAIEPVDLPADAWQTGRRPWVQEAYLAAAEKKVESATTAVAAANERLATLRAKQDLLARSPASAAPAAEASPGPSLADNFATFDEGRWQRFGGDWKHEPGRLEQKLDGATRSVVRWREAPPRDFDATIKFTIRGGSQWRSVCLAFDSTQEDPSSETTENEQIVYVSAHAGGPKVQAAYSKHGQWHYPQDGMQSRSIELDRQYTFRVQVRDTLVNASLDGEPVLAWRSPLARRDGAMQLTTFDALAIFHEISIQPLAADVALREPNQKTTRDIAELARLAEKEVEVATLAERLAKAELESTQRRIKAGELTGDEATADAAVARQDAVAAERRAKLAAAQHDVAQAELLLQQAADDKRQQLEKELAEKQASLAKAKRNAGVPIEPDDSFTSFEGSRWVATRFLTSTADDPTVTTPPESTGRRTALARWITDKRHPLTARVAVNHLWTRHLGAPLVPNVFDFGRNSIPPVNQPLLDWLAAEFVDSGWSMKHIHRLIVSSAAYRRSSSAVGQEANIAKDPENRYWWRRNPIRLESQAVRDSILALAKTLDETRGGPPVAMKDQESSKRRSLYFFHSNNDRNLFLTTFDEAMVKECYRRDQSIVPQQALALTNSALVLEASRQIAAELSKTSEKAATDDEAFVRCAFKFVLGTQADAAEVAASLKALRAWQDIEKKSQAEAPSNEHNATAAMSARANLVWVLLNHNDFVTLR